MLTRAAATMTELTVEGTLNSTPNTMFRVELFASAAADPTGFGEGQTYLGATDVTTDAGGNASFEQCASRRGPRRPIHRGNGHRAAKRQQWSRLWRYFGIRQAVAVEAASTGEIRGIVWRDLDVDGSRGSNEPGVAGWTVFLDDDHDGQLDSNERSTATDTGGNYAFGDLPPGEYDVAQLVHPGWNQTFPKVVPEWIYVAVQEPQLPFQLRHNVIRVYDFDGNSVETIMHDEFELGSIFDVEIGPEGNVFVALDTFPYGVDGEIVQFTSDGEFLRVIDLPEDPDATGAFFIPMVLTCCPTAASWWRSPMDNRLFTWTQTASLLDTFPVPGTNPQDVAIRSDGEIVLALSVAGEMVNVRGDDMYWVGHGTTLLDNRRPVDDRGVDTIDPLEAADGSLYATTRWPQQILQSGMPTGTSFGRSTPWAFPRG